MEFYQVGHIYRQSTDEESLPPLSTLNDYFASVVQATTPNTPTVPLDCDIWLPAFDSLFFPEQMSTRLYHQSRHPQLQVMNKFLDLSFRSWQMLLHLISPFFCIYIDKLLLELSKSGFGCFIGEVFLGALAYADDIVLLAPTHRAMRNMLAFCDKFASEYHVVFNAKKSKCLYINSCANRSRISPPCLTSLLAAIILHLWMSGLISGILSLQIVMIKVTLLANEIPYVVKSITYCAFLVNVIQLLSCHC